MEFGIAINGVCEWSSLDMLIIYAWVFPLEQKP